MHVAGVDEQLAVVGLGHQLAGGVDVALEPEERVALHAVHLHRDAGRPAVGERGCRRARLEQQRPAAPGRVWARRWAGMTPSEMPA